MKNKLLKAHLGPKNFKKIKYSTHKKARTKRTGCKEFVAKGYKIKKGLSLRPAFTALLSFLNLLRIQLKNFVIMASGFSVNELDNLSSTGRNKPDKNSARNFVVVGNSWGMPVR